MRHYSSVSSHPLRVYANRAAQRELGTKRQGMKVSDKETSTDAESTPEQILTPSTPMWVFTVLIGLGLFMIGLVWWFGVFARPVLEATPVTRALVTPQWQARIPVEQALLPTPTPSPSSVTAALPVSASAVVSDTPVPLPTVTATRKANQPVHAPPRYRALRLCVWSCPMRALPAVGNRCALRLSRGLTRLA